MEQIGRISLNNHEEMWISLKEVCKAWQVELRLCSRSDAGLPETPRVRSVINLPIEQLLMFLERLAQVRDSCLKRGLLGDDAGGEMVAMSGGESVVVKDYYRVRGHRGRRHPRMAVRYSVLCQTPATEQSPHSMILRGEFRDLSVGGAQIWLPCRLGLGQQVEVAGMIEGQPFRAKGEIVGAGVQVRKGPDGGLIRHSLKWLSYNGAAGDILAMTLAQPARGEATQAESFPESKAKAQQAAVASAAE